jgi:hypothetical protein
VAAIHVTCEKLSFRDCSLADEDIDAIARAMVQGNNRLHRHGSTNHNNNNNNNSLKELDFSCNPFLSPLALQSLGLLTPSLFPHLQKLLLNNNPDLFEDEEIAQRFAENVRGNVVAELLLCLRELNICSSSLPRVHGFTTTLQALETNRTLVQLCISVYGDPYYDEDETLAFEPIRNQLVATLPRMHGLQRLIIDEGLLEKNKDDPELQMSFRENTSLLKTLPYLVGSSYIRVTRPFFVDNLKRSNDLVHVEYALWGTTTEEQQNVTIRRNVHGDVDDK